MTDTARRQRDLDQLVRELQNHLTSSSADPDQLLKRAVIASGSGITIADARKRDMPLIYTNPAFERITGYTAEEAVGHNCRFLHKGEPDQEGLNEVRRAIREEREGFAILRNYRKDGSLFWNELYIAPIHDGEGRLTHFIGVQNDVTARVELEEEREFFLQVASHDLKSPLHAILLTATTFESVAPVGSEVTGQLLDILNNITTRAKEMQSIIDDYLDLQKLETGAGKTRSEEVNLEKLVETVLEANSGHSADKEISISHECTAASPVVMGDPLKISQVTQNLVGNAIKFSPRGSRIAVRIEQTDKSLRVEVTDQGPGLSDEDLQRVFGKFARLSNKPTGGEKSSGLGLHISKRLIEMQGGEIGVFNNTEQGATFWFSLP